MTTATMSLYNVKPVARERMCQNVQRKKCMDEYVSKRFRVAVKARQEIMQAWLQRAGSRSERKRETFST